MGILQIILAAIVTLGILVTIHEYGHFWVARRCGVKVLRFSVGFGKGLFSWRDKMGTEYVIAAIPLGGYVKMLDEREGEVPDSLLDQAFNRKTVWQRIAIVAAGPVVNLAFAVLAYWFLFIYGVSTVAPVIGDITGGSPAEIAGLVSKEEIVSVDGYPTRSWEEVGLRLAARIGETGQLQITTRSVDLGGEQRYRVVINSWKVDEEKGPLYSLGIAPFRPPVPAIIGQLVEGGRAEAAGLRVGDLVQQLDNQPVNDWYELVSQIQANPENQVVLTLVRDGQPVELNITPAKQSAGDGREYGYIGAGVEPPVWPDWLLREISYSPLEAIPAALNKTQQLVVLIIESIGKMIQGEISVKNLSGPITIAKVAGASAESGLESFLNFLAYLSISLGILNLLPIPMLDGGHILYYVIEAIRGRPVSEKTQLVGLKIGMALLMALMFLAFYNDLARL
ncbi:RIP metalloprotease RseP [Motiliproteus sp. MSK22-1]|uniref:RIP metalloprotease RseP n=1 Tax=Motiliproteus sp. MSK22-1 TaxID=1897630 RepID=UPI000975C0C3|nr:RIP metalloprotease RseP [Motiliproteus sp. MSK22-1]OMH39164.1 RIP metalloprotease RseP [Motiliproteus sp. MSK22-1]